MPAVTFGFHFFDPPPSNNLNKPAQSNQIQPFLVLFASSPDCLPIAQKLSETGWLVLAVDSRQPTYVELALDLISPLALQSHWKWLKPAAIILVTDAQLTARPYPSAESALTLPFYHLTKLLLGRGLSFQEIPYVLYCNVPISPASPATTEELTPIVDYIELDSTTPTTNSIFRAVVQRTGLGEELLAVIADLTQVIFCAGCRRKIEPHEKALLLAPQLFCESCASFPSAVIDRYPQERLPLFPARFLAKAARVFATSSAAKRPSDLVLSVEEAISTTNTSDPWSS